MVQGNVLDKTEEESYNIEKLLVLFRFHLKFICISRKFAKQYSSNQTNMLYVYIRVFIFINASDQYRFYYRTFLS